MLWLSIYFNMHLIFYMELVPVTLKVIQWSMIIVHVKCTDFSLKNRQWKAVCAHVFCVIWFENSNVRICTEIYLILWTKVFYFERNSMITEPQNGLNFHFSFLQSKLLLRPLSPFLSLQGCLLSNLNSLTGAHNQNYHDVK